MKRIYTIAILVFLTTSFISAIDYQSVGKGDWYVGSTWNWNKIPANNDAATIKHAVVASADIVLPVTIIIDEYKSLISSANMRIQNNCTLWVKSNAYLEVNNLQLDNGCTFIVEENATLEVLGDFTIKNNSDIITLVIEVDGTINVAGEFENKLHGEVYGSGQICAGIFSGGGSTFGTIPNSSFLPGTCASGNVLPVELVDFNASRNNGEVILSWQTASEINNSHFEIERSNDGKSFSAVDVTMGKGTTSEFSSYTYIDQYAPKCNSFYRLKQVDFNGEYSYSNIVMVETELDFSGFSVYPNPVISELIIDNRASAEAFGSSFSIHDISGKMVYKSDVTSETQTIDVSGLQAGIYYVTIESGNTSASRMVIKE